VLKGVSIYGEKAKELGISEKPPGLFIARGFFSTITNVNWKNDWFINQITESL
jgi:hydroxylamine reductase